MKLIVSATRPRFPHREDEAHLGSISTRLNKSSRAGLFIFKDSTKASKSSSLADSPDSSFRQMWLMSIEQGAPSWAKSAVRGPAQVDKRDSSSQGLFCAPGRPHQRTKLMSSRRPRRMSFECPHRFSQGSF